MGILLYIVVLILPQASHAIDLGFRFEDGFCQKSNSPGTNPEFFGECGNLTKSRFINQTFKDIKLLGGVFNSSYFYVTRMDGGNLSHASFRRSIVLQTNIQEVEATHLDVRGGHFKSVNFTKSNLQNLFATGTRFTKVNFQDCDLRHASFWGSLLQEVSFKGADLRDANLEQVFIFLSDLEGAKFNAKTKLPFSEEVALKKGMVKID